MSKLVSGILPACVKVACGFSTAVTGDSRKRAKMQMPNISTSFDAIDMDHKEKQKKIHKERNEDEMVKRTRGAWKYK